MRTQYEVKLVKSLGNKSVTDTFTAPYKVGQLSDDGYWELLALERPPGTPLSIAENSEGALEEFSIGQQILGEGAGDASWHWQVGISSLTKDQIAIEFKVTGEPTEEHGYKGIEAGVEAFGSQFPIVVDGPDPKARLAMLI